MQPESPALRKESKASCGAAMVRFARRRRGAPQKSLMMICQLIVIFLFLVGFVVFNYDYVLHRRQQLLGRRRQGNEHQWIDAVNTRPFDENGVASSATNLVIVAGHSVLISGHLQDADRDEQDWFLLDYQKGKGLPDAIVAHIQAGMAEAAADPEALLVFSGGETRANAGPETEGASYYRVADAMHLWPDDTSLRARTITEEFARDSFENLSFSICRFFEVTRRYPSKITVVSFTFKQRRFETLHAPALRWPDSRFAYIGVDPPASTGFDLIESSKGELENAAKPFENDPYGCHSEALKEKRNLRNPFHRTAPYDLSCPHMKELFHYCGPELIPRERVPW